MSEHLTKLEVEDVLSSIRRLVKSNDFIEPKIGNETNHIQHDKLLLSPSFRVDLPEQDETAADVQSPLILQNAVLPAGASENPPREQDDHAEAESDVSLETASSEDKQSKTPSAASELSAKIAALETAIGKISGQWEPDTPGEDDYSGTKAPAIIWQDDVELDARGKPIRTGQDKSPEDLSDLPFIPGGQQKTPEREVVDEILDEEALHKLVADIVRSELQGELGARITRNVRKLVRREIHRALAARDLG
jgi:hypothetical protein